MTCVRFKRISKPASAPMFSCHFAADGSRWLPWLKQGSVHLLGLSRSSSLSAMAGCPLVVPRHSQGKESLATWSAIWSRPQSLPAALVPKEWPTTCRPTKPCETRFLQGNSFLFACDDPAQSILCWWLLMVSTHPKEKWKSTRIIIPGRKNNHLSNHQPRLQYVTTPLDKLLWWLYLATFYGVTCRKLVDIQFQFLVLENDLNHSIWSQH